MTGIRASYVYIMLFVLGIMGVQLSPVLLPARLSLLAGGILIPCFFARALRPFAFLAIGTVWAMLRADLVLRAEWPSFAESRDVMLVGTITGLPELGTRYLKFDLEVERARLEGREIEFSGWVRLRWYRPPAQAAARLKAGTRWRLRVRLKQPHGYYNPGGFDYEAYLYSDRIRATGYVRKAGPNVRLGTAKGCSIDMLRQVLSDRLRAAMHGLDFPGILRALALGDSSSISDAQWATLRATGTIHLISISGLHVGFVAGLGVLFGLWIGRAVMLLNPSIAAPRVGALGGLAMAFGYSVLSGFEVPAQRTFVMAGVLFLGLLCRRHVWNPRGFCLALGVVLALNPAAVHTPGFWLSFIGVALILAWLRGQQRVGSPDRPLTAAVKLQCVLSLALLPMVAGFFGAASMVSAPANLVAVPIVVFGIVPLCLVALASVAVGFQSGASWSMAAADTIFAPLWQLLSWLANLDFSVVQLNIEFWQALVLTGGILWLLAVSGRRRLWAAMTAIVLLAPGLPPPRAGEFRATVLDVGQGLAVVVRTRRHLLVYDTGPRYASGFSLADAVVIPFLRARNVGAIDTLIVSHGHNDHRGGFEDLTAAFPVARVLSSVAEELGGRAEYCRRGQDWQWDGVRFEMLHPDAVAPPPGNNSSCVLRIEGPYGSLLLTADIEAPAEAALARVFASALHSEVLLVPHQGSKTSSTPVFLDRVDPRWALVSAGYLNRYGHPHAVVVKRYRKRGIALANTARRGAILVNVARDGISVHGWRELHPRYWLDRPDIRSAQFDKLNR